MSRVHATIRPHRLRVTDSNRRTVPAMFVMAAVFLLQMLLHTDSAFGQLLCLEPDPVGNAYRTAWNRGVPGSELTYSCFETYVHTAGDLTRTCDGASGNYSGQAPVCTLNCSQPLTESMSEIVSMNDTMSLDNAVYQCTGNTVGSDFPVIICADTLGHWNNTALDCQEPDNLILANQTSMSPQGSDDPANVTDGSEDTYITMLDNTEWTANLTGSQDKKVEVTQLELTLKVNIPETYMPCRYTSLGLEYAGTWETTSKRKQCQRWSSQYPWQHSYTDDSFFPADGDVSAANNYCRNPNASDVRPWCYTTDTGVEKETCLVPACAKLWMHVVYVDETGNEKTHACTDGNSWEPRPLLNAADNPRNLAIKCRNPSTGRLPAGHQLRITFVSSADNVTLDLHEVKAYGHPYVEGCGDPLGYWGLELVTAILPSTLYSTADYRCRSGWHWRGGPLQAKCTESRTWQTPDLSQCTDEPNHASAAPVVFDNGLVSGVPADVLDDDLSSCVEVGVHDTALNLTLSVPLEIAEVVVTTEGDENLTMTAHVEIVNPNTGQRQWRYHQSFNAGPSRTHLFNSVLRPVAQTIRLRAEPGPDPSNANINTWRICEVKVFGRVFTSALECLQSNKGGDYKGQWNITVSGRTCQRWDSSQPHNNNYTDIAAFPDVSLSDASNFCRNPTSSNGEVDNLPWCYTTDPDVEWEYCPLFKCDDICRLRADGADYTGRISKTVSGTECQNWEWSGNTRDQFHFMRSHYFSTARRERWCRNPVASQSAPWCYVNRSPHERQFCDIPTCPLPGEPSPMWVDPNNASSLPEWLTANQFEVRECWVWHSPAFGEKSRRTSIHEWLHCGNAPDTKAVFCDFIDHDNQTRWNYFWFNCSWEAEPTTAATVSGTTLGAAAVSTATSTSACPDTCSEVCDPVRNVTDAELEKIVQKIQKELLVDTSKLSATIRKKESATDNRPSAITTGCLGIVLVVAVVALVVSNDVITVIRFLSELAHRKPGDTPKEN